MPDHQNSKIGFQFSQVAKDPQHETIARFLQLKSFDNILPVPAQGNAIGFRDTKNKISLGSVDRDHLGRIYAIVISKKTEGSTFLADRIAAIKGTHLNKEVLNPDRTTLQVIRGGKSRQETSAGAEADIGLTADM